MEFKYINDRNKTPQSKVFSSTANCERFFNLPQDISTPPSRFSKIVNPFECRLLDRLHLPTFSPSVFAKQSTPKTDEKFRWTIDEISSLKPAYIDEETISQHVFDEDPQMESLAQQKIDQFFSEKVIVPSPMIDIIRVPLIADNSANLFLPQQPKEYTDGSAQTMLSLPPILPAHIEDILKPYFMPEENEQMYATDPITEMKSSYLFRNLFRNCDHMEPPVEDHDIVKSHSMSVEDLSPVRSPAQLTGRHSLPFEMPDLHECSLSPIGGSHNNRSSKDSRSAVRLDFSSKSSSDASMAVPDIGNEVSTNSELLEFSQNNPQPLEPLSESPINWDMENAHVSLVTPGSSPESKIMDVNPNTTPHSKIFTSQRKRLSHSFIIDEEESTKDHESSVDNLKQSRKFFRNDVTDAGYHTESALFYEESRYSVHMFASTPTKMRRNENVQEPHDLIF